MVRKQEQRDQSNYTVAGRFIFGIFFGYLAFGFQASQFYCRLAGLLLDKPILPASLTYAGEEKNTYGFATNNLTPVLMRVALSSTLPRRRRSSLVFAFWAAWKAALGPFISPRFPKESSPSR